MVSELLSLILIIWVYGLVQMMDLLLLWNLGVELLPAVMKMMCLNIKEGCDSWSLENMKL